MSEHRVVDLKCGCKSIVTNGSGDSWASIDFCPTHEAATDLLAAVRDALAAIASNDSQRELGLQQAAERGYAAIAKASGR